MSQRRLYYRVILKVLTTVALLLLSIVFLKSLLTPEKNSTKAEDKNVPQIFIRLNELQKGKVIKRYWGNKEIAVLYRNTPNGDLLDGKVTELGLSSSPSRSRNPSYFVYINHGDSGNCPLFYSNDSFKDICTGALFDDTGRKKSNKLHGYKIQLPPHYFLDQKIFIGAWKP